MNLPNKLTVSRFAMTAAFMVVLFSQIRFHETIALLLFGAAAITDWLDGSIARRRNLITNFGKLMDPLADKIMVCSAFIAFVGLSDGSGKSWVSAWMVVVIVAREFAITGLRLLAATKNLVLAAEGYGKHKTITQMVAIIAIFIFHSYGEWGSFGNIFGTTIAGKPWVQWLAEISTWLAVVLTIFSGVTYLWRNRQLFLSDM